jgi:hypothetical protein
MGIIRSNYINFHETMCICGAKFLKISNNLFKLQFLMHLIYVLCNFSVIEYSYQGFNWIIL